MEPLAALSLVCNILQLVEVGSQSYELIKNVYQKGSIDDSLKQKAIMLEKISEDIKPVNRPAKKHEQQLVETAESCARVARQLREEIIYLVRHAKRGRLSSSVKTALMTLWRKPRLERLKNELDDAEKLMHTSLLVQIMSTVDDAELDLTDLAADVRAFVQEYRKGHLETKRLVSREGLETRTHVSTTIQSTNEAIEGVSLNLRKLALSVDVQFDQAKGERLLQSLKYPGFNERRNEVSEAHTDTFRWVFAGDGGKLAESDSKMSTVKWDSFSNWLKSTDNIYWINGKPGSGKSTMVKYILADPQTQQCLDIWSPGCLIISHYFWRPGNPLQRSIKGLLCSLLRQLVDNSRTALGGVLAMVTVSSTKDDVTDWSHEELLSILLSTMEAYDRPVCMFLDGLDEVEPDEHTTLLDMIMKLSVAGETKMCLASRPEPPLQQRLYNMPQLRLQDLTVTDLTQYAYDNLNTQVSKFSDRSTYKDFVKSLVRRAEGVFLWLVLVTKTVRKGFDNGDNIRIINERVDNLQGGDLEYLYKDMWERAAKDNPNTYRQTAALYFRIVLLYNLGVNLHLQMYGTNLSVFTMMLATTEYAEKTLDAAQPLDLVSEETLFRACTEVERMAEIYCFGLLEICDQNDNQIIKDMVGWYRGKYDKLLPYAQGHRVLRFIHRTAVDFLIDTAEGNDILSFDKNAESSHAFQLVAANLAHAKLFCDVTEDNSLAAYHLYSIDHVRKYCIEADESVTADFIRTMRNFRRICDLERLFAVRESNEAFACSGVDFFKEVAMYSWRCLDIIPEDQIKALDKGTLSEILQIICSPWHIFSPSHLTDEISKTDVLQLIGSLLLEGADPNWNGTTAFADMASRIDGESYTLRGTPFVLFLSRMLEQAKNNWGHGPYRWKESLPLNDLTKILITLQTFISRGANLDEKVTIVLKTGAAESPQTQTYQPLFPGEREFFDEQTSNNGHMFICSFPAHKVLNLVLSREPLRRLSNAEKVLADIKSSITCNTSKRGRMNDTVLLRLESTGSASAYAAGNGRPEWKCFVAPQEHQDQIADELMHHMFFSSVSDDGPFDLEPSAAIQALGYETWTSMLCGSLWVERRSGPLENVLDYLAELGIFARRSISGEIHTIRDWLKQKGVLDTLE